jgi:hypothetical protein
MIKRVFVLLGAFMVILTMALSASDQSGNAPGADKSAAESCVSAAKGPLGAVMAAESAALPASGSAYVPQMARVGKPAPDFEATAFQNGAFRNLKLSELHGKWVVLCFYPGDFTFV